MSQLLTRGRDGRLHLPAPAQKTALCTILLDERGRRFDLASTLAWFLNYRKGTGVQPDVRTSELCIPCLRLSDDEVSGRLADLCPVPKRQAYSRETPLVSCAPPDVEPALRGGISVPSADIPPRVDRYTHWNHVSHDSTRAPVFEPDAELFIEHPFLPDEAGRLVPKHNGKPLTKPTAQARMRRAQPVFKPTKTKRNQEKFRKVHEGTLHPKNFDRAVARSHALIAMLRQADLPDTKGITEDGQRAAQRMLDEHRRPVGNDIKGKPIYGLASVQLKRALRTPTSGFGQMANLMLVKPRKVWLDVGNDTERNPHNS